MPQNDGRLSPYALPGPYTTSLDPNQENQFEKWVKDNKIPWQDSPTADYDMRGFWKAQQSGDPNAKRATNLHFPDTYKTPYHKTFSNQSKYATQDAPHWVGNQLIGKDGKLIADEGAPSTPKNSLTQTLDDPAFGKLSPEAQKIVLGKYGVSPEMQGKLLDHLGKKTVSVGGSWTPETTNESIERMPESQALEREVGAAGGALKGAVTGAASIAASPFMETSPVTPEEKRVYGFQEHPNAAGRFGQEVARQTFIPVAEAVGFYKKNLSDPKLRATLLDRMLDIAPEAIGTAGGTVLAGKATEGLGEKAGAAAKSASEIPGIKTRADAEFNRIGTKADHLPVDLTAIEAQLDKIQDLGKHGHKVPTIVNQMKDWIEEMRKPSTTPIEGGHVDTPGTSMPMTFLDLRKFRKAMDNAINWEEVKGSKEMDREFKHLRYLSDVEEIKTANKVGEAANYVKAKAQWKKGLDVERAGGVAGGTVGAVAGGAAGYATGEALPGMGHHPYLFGGAGTGIGRKVGAKVGVGLAKKLTEMGKQERIPAAVEAAKQIREEAKASVEAARNFPTSKPTPKAATPKATGMAKTGETLESTTSTPKGQIVENVAGEKTVHNSLEDWVKSHGFPVRKTNTGYEVHIPYANKAGGKWYAFSNLREAREALGYGNPSKGQ